jgi:hypothetical protein
MSNVEPDVHSGPLYTTGVRELHSRESESRGEVLHGHKRVR